MIEKSEKEVTYLFDLDGTLILGDEKTPYAAELIDFLNQRQREFFIITNGCALSPGAIWEKLKNMNIKVKRENIITTAEVMADILSTKYKDNGIFVAGAKWLKDYLADLGFRLVRRDPGAVVVSYDKNTSFADIEDCIRFIQGGADYLSTNDDLFIPGMGHIYPHTGMINTAIESIVRRKPIIAGKPSLHFLKRIQQRAQGKERRFCVVGDSLATDITFAWNCGVTSYLVLTGVTGIDDIIRSHVKIPDKVFADLRGLLELEKSQCPGRYQ